MEEEGKIPGKYFFHRKIPLLRPSSPIDSLFYRLGYLSKEYVLRRENLMLEAFNNHVRDTVIRDRQMLLGRIMLEKNSLSESLLEEIESLREDNRRLSDAQKK
jgi:hypothetical protein